MWCVYHEPVPLIVLRFQLYCDVLTKLHLQHAAATEHRTEYAAAVVLGYGDLGDIETGLIQFHRIHFTYEGELIGAAAGIDQLQTEIFI